MFADFDIFYKAAQALLAGQSPYSIPGFFNPAWALIPFIPLTLLPLDTAKIAYAVMTVLGVLAALYRYRIKPLIVAALVLFSPLIIANLILMNVDWLVLLGATLPAPIGIWFVLMKPQLAIGIVALWLWQRRPRQWLLFVPAFAALLLNYAILGLPVVSVADYNPTPASVFPFGLPIAAWLMWQALKRRSINFALPASLFAAPYTSIVSWLALAPLAQSWRWLLIVLAISWPIWLIW